MSIVVPWHLRHGANRRFHMTRRLRRSPWQWWTILGFLVSSGVWAQSVGDTDASTKEGPNVGFGKERTFVLSDDFQGDISLSFRTGTQLNISLHPALDSFIHDHVSLGGMVIVGTNIGGGSQLTLGAGVRMGYEIPAET